MVPLSFKHHRKDIKIHDLLQKNAFAYNTVLSDINRTLDKYTDNNDKCLLLDYYIRIIKKNIIADYDNWIIDPRYVELAEKGKKYFCFPRIGWFNVPTYYYDSNGLYVSVKSGNQVIELASSDVLCYPTDSYKIIRMKKAAELKKFNTAIAHSIAFIPYINLCIVLSGGHHQISVNRAFKKQLSLEVECIDWTKLFEFVFTDGARWFYSNKPDIKDDEVCDYRLPLLFSLAKQKYYYETNN